MAVGAAIAGVGLGLKGAKEARRGRQQAAAAGAKAEAQQRETTEEEIRRQEYTHKRDIASIEAEIAAGGISDVGALRQPKKTKSTFDKSIATAKSEIAGLHKKIAAEEKRVDDEELGWVSKGGIRSMESEIDKKYESLEAMQAARKGELAVPWEGKTGIFGQYLAEKERVHLSEIDWMRKTGLSGVESIRARTQSALSAARSQETAAFSKIVSSGAAWYQASQPPPATTTTG